MNELLNRLKNSVNPYILNKVDMQLLEQYNFVPISVKDSFLFVVVCSSSDKPVINLKLKEYFTEQVKFILIPDKDFKDLQEELKKDKDSDKIDDGTNKQVKLGELLIQKGYISDVQLLQALAESKRQKEPIGSTLFKLGFITLDQLKEILHLQTGYEMVTPEQLAQQDKFVNILPEDFIKEHKIIPISSDGKTLILGVVKPVKPDVLKEIIYMTGQNPKQLLMTHYEFETSLNTFFSVQKKETQKIIQEIEDESAEFEQEESLSQMVASELEDATGSVAKFVNQIITNAIRSEEHTSELQSPDHLVCRLLL